MTLFGTGCRRFSGKIRALCKRLVHLLNSFCQHLVHRQSCPVKKLSRRSYPTNYRVPGTWLSANFGRSRPRPSIVQSIHHAQSQYRANAMLVSSHGRPVEQLNRSSDGAATRRERGNRNDRAIGWSASILSKSGLNRTTPRSSSVHKTTESVDYCCALGLLLVPRGEILAAEDSHPAEISRSHQDLCPHFVAWNARLSFLTARDTLIATTVYTKR